MTLRKPTTKKTPYPVKPNSINKSASKMLNNTKRQAKKNNIELPKDIEKYYATAYTSSVVVETPKTYNINKSDELNSLENINPKLSNRFIVTFPDYFKIPKWSVASVIRPIVNNEQGGEFYVKLHDLTSISVSKRLLKMINLLPFKLKLEMVDPTGAPIETWVFKKCVIKNIIWSELSYDINNLSTINLNIKFEKLKIK